MPSHGAARITATHSSVVAGEPPRASTRSTKTTASTKPDSEIARTTHCHGVPGTVAVCSCGGIREWSGGRRATILLPDAHAEDRPTAASDHARAAQHGGPAVAA